MSAGKHLLVECLFQKSPAVPPQIFTPKGGRARDRGDIEGNEQGRYSSRLQPAALFPSPLWSEGSGWGRKSQKEEKTKGFIQSMQGENVISTARLNSPNALASKSMTCIIAWSLILGRHIRVPHAISDSIRDSLSRGKVQAAAYQRHSLTPLFF